MRNKYAQLIYNPLLRDAFAYSCRAQLEEFHRLYDRSPSHIDGHHHMHLCANVVLGQLIPRGMTVRRHFSFWPAKKAFSIVLTETLLIGGLLANTDFGIIFSI